MLSLTVTGPGEADTVRLNIAAQERHEAVGQALAQLSEEDRAVVVLCEMDECSGREISELLGISRSQVSVRLLRGMEKLGRSLSGWADENTLRQPS